MGKREIVVACIVAIIAGGALLAAWDALVPLLVGCMLIGIGGVVLVSLAFYVVGESEDRDRERHPHG